MGGDTKVLHDILAIVTFIKDNAATKEELAKSLNNLRFEFDKKLNAATGQLRNEIITHVDGFIGLHKKLDTEYAALYYKHNRLENRVIKLEKKKI